MKLASVQSDSGPARVAAVLVENDSNQASRLIDLAAAAAIAGGAIAAQGASLTSIQSLLEAGDTGRSAAAAALRFAREQGLGDPRWSLEPGSVKLRAPLAKPGKILALAGNYRAHRAEGGVSSPEPDQALPEVFCKPATSIVGPEEPILLPGPPVVAVDYEGELGVVIGRRCSRVSADEALGYVGGYLCLNDVSGRKLDPGFERSPELLARAKFFDWLAGKWFDTFCPIGPWLVTADEIADPMSLTLLTRVNGEERQRTLTGEMIHSIARTIAWCSTIDTLEPGDVIATGTPSGVGSASGRFLKVGDVVEVEISGVGVLRNPVAARSA